MTRVEAEEFVTLVEEWLDLREETRRFQRGSNERQVAFLLSEAARERLIERLSGEEGTPVQAEVPV